MPNAEHAWIKISGRQPARLHHTQVIACENFIGMRRATLTLLQIVMAVAFAGGDDLRLQESAAADHGFRGYGQCRAFDTAQIR